ncbi:LacI family DNA-binding transcriptional regulator [Roseobacter sp. HKCCA0434]|uniref:LacI family DNA-binding transcriptional regulator n=1 Tax=Roseobacter sp. HKCCA0434 TaxID=3079297 RepID=UPI002905A8D6|nr:LacI family DNA-binding transcriptional regulator [Roseobacter sp. HKCCA0434]
MRNSKVTLADVAAEAEVSTITVSRALNRPEIVSEQVRKRVRDAVGRLGYVPNQAARLLASGRSNVIGVVIPSISNNVFTDVLRGIYEAVEATPFEIQLANARYKPEREESLLRIFAAQRPAGLIVAGIDQTEAARGILDTLDAPVVQIMEIGADPVDMAIGFSQGDAAAAATAHLIAQGYRRPGFLGARLDPRTRRRFEGFRRACEAKGLFDPDCMETTEQASSIQLGGELLAALLTRRPETDAVFCNNDDIAIGALFEAHRRGIAVPERLGICGFNDLEIVRHSVPAVTSVATPLYEMGRGAVELIAARLKGEDQPEPVRDMGFRLMARDSTQRR